MVRPNKQIPGREFCIGGKQTQTNLVESKILLPSRCQVSQPGDLNRVEPCILNRLALRDGSNRPKAVNVILSFNQSLWLRIGGQNVARKQKFPGSDSG